LANYTVEGRTVEGHRAYHLIDRRRRMDYGVIPDIGNWGYSFTVNGRDVLLPPDSVEQYIKDRSLGRGNPIMAPFANRIDRDHYFFNGKKYLLNGDLGNFLRTPSTDYPIHGLLAYDERWQVVDTSFSDFSGASVTSRIEFYRYPDLMAQFPFAHVHEVQYRLKGGKLDCTTRITNLGKSEMPVHFGYHPYFVPGGPREEWSLHVAAGSHWVTAPDLIPTGELEPAEQALPGCTRTLTLRKTFIDAGFSNLRRDKKGLAHFWVAGSSGRIEVILDQGFSTAVVFAPLDMQFICIEPQTGPTNAFNLKHEGKINQLTVLAPGKTFRASYRIVPTGF